MGVSAKGCDKRSGKGRDNARSSDFHGGDAGKRAGTLAAGCAYPRGSAERPACAHPPRRSPPPPSLDTYTFKLTTKPDARSGFWLLAIGRVEDRHAERKRTETDHILIADYGGGNGMHRQGVDARAVAAAEIDQVEAIFAGAEHRMDA